MHTTVKGSTSAAETAESLSGTSKPTSRAALMPLILVVNHMHSPGALPPSYNDNLLLSDQPIVTR
jgi:hypothetical protein